MPVIQAEVKMLFDFPGSGNGKTKDNLQWNFHFCAIYDGIWLRRNFAHIGVGGFNEDYQEIDIEIFNYNNISIVID